MSDFLSEEDKALFRRAVGEVTPLKKSNKQEKEQKTCIHAHKKTNNCYKPGNLSSFYLSDFSEEEVHAETFLNYKAYEIPNKRWRELKMGQIPWQAKLDLHGLQAEKAREQLAHFIKQSYLHSKRCVLIIHGKGGLRNEAPVIKNLVNTWLKQIPYVLAFHSALPKEGGSGALYVLLRKNN